MQQADQSVVEVRAPQPASPSSGHLFRQLEALDLQEQRLLDQLRQAIAGYGRVCVAYSGSSNGSSWRKRCPEDGDAACGVRSSTKGLISSHLKVKLMAL